MGPLVEKIHAHNTCIFMESIGLLIFALQKDKKVMALNIFKNFKTLHLYVLKNYGFKYIERYMQEEHTQKSPVKKYFIF
jgi:hypothetical protein